MKINRIAILGLLLLIAAACFFLFRPDKINVETGDNTIIKSNYSFIYEHWKEEGLRRLFDRENYKDIKAESQFDLFIKLCDWTHSQWEHSIPDPYPLSNALDILDDIRSGKTGGFCGQYSYVLADVLKSLGFFAVRYVEISDRSGNSHFVVEAWCDQFEKWVILDPDRNVFYRLQDSVTPANAVEIHRAYLENGDISEVDIGTGEVRAKPGSMSLYYNFAVSMRSDLIRHRKPLTIQDRLDMFLFYRDEGRNDVPPYRNVTSRLNDIYFDCNKVRIEWEEGEDGKSVILSFFTDQSMPNFSSFMVSSDNGKNWRLSEGTESITGSCCIQVKPVNAAGRPGCVNYAVVSNGLWFQVP